ncbi:MAG: hypothetical protein R6W96_07900 [Clostridia bacterium]
MNLSKSIDFLLENAGAVIQYRLHKEILKDLSPAEEENLLEKVCQMPKYKELLNYVHPSGYIGMGAHSADRFKQSPLDDGEAAARLLSYYGIPKENPVAADFIAAISDENVLRGEFAYYNADAIRFENRLRGMNSGATTIGLFCTMLAMLGEGDTDYVKPFLDVSLMAFRSMLDIESLDEITLPATKSSRHPYITEDQYLPCAYHLATLAYTKSWRTPENVRMMSDAMNHMNRIMKPNNEINAKIDGKFIGPGWALIRPFEPFRVDYHSSIMYRRPLTEIAMLGSGESIEVILQSAQNVREALGQDDVLRFGFENTQQKRKHFPVTGLYPTPYSDVCLEENYITDTSIDCDLTFWAVQFLNFVEGE